MAMRYREDDGMITKVVSIAVEAASFNIVIDSIRLISKSLITANDDSNPSKITRVD